MAEDNTNCQEPMDGALAECEDDEDEGEIRIVVHEGHPFFITSPTVSPQSLLSQ